MTNLTEQYLKQLTLIEEKYSFIREKYTSEMKYSNTDIREIFTTAIAAIDRISGINSAYSKEIHSIHNRSYDDVHYLIGIVRALHNDLANGFLNDIAEIIHGEMFSDFLEMAEYLSTEGYKDAAAVMIGGVLESHLRQLAVKHEVALEIVISTEVKPKKAEQLNADLTKKNVYNKLEQKNVTAWLDLRNKAAHAHYGEYTKDHVSLMLQGVRNFITRYPA